MLATVEPEGLAAPDQAEEGGVMKPVIISGSGAAEVPIQGESVSEGEDDLGGYALPPWGDGGDLSDPSEPI